MTKFFDPEKPGIHEFHERLKELTSEFTEGSDTDGPKIAMTDMVMVLAQITGGIMFLALIEQDEKDLQFLRAAHERAMEMACSRAAAQTSMLLNEDGEE